MADVSSSPTVPGFTPSHRGTYLDECLESLLRQTFTDWEWVVLLNGGARWRPASADPRIRVEVDDELSGVGAAKRRACLLSRGEFLVELDHDDVLASTALERGGEGFDAKPDASLVYSHCAQILEDGSRDDSRFDERYGWTFRDVDVDGRSVLQIDALQPSPHNVSYIWYAPNHVRAMRRSLYDE